MDPLGDGRGYSTDTQEWAKMAPVKSEGLSKGNIFSVEISKERELVVSSPKGYNKEWQD